MFNEECERFESFKHTHSHACEHWEMILWKHTKSTAAAAALAYGVLPFWYFDKDGDTG
jgi:hypothetical protein